MLKKREIEEEFRTWLNDQSGRYEWEHTKECAFATFLQHKHGEDADVVVLPYHYKVDDVYETIPSPLHAQLRYAGTYERLRELIDSGQTF
jgi:hypothetical protein